MSRDLAMKALDLQVDMSRWVRTTPGFKYCNAIYDDEAMKGPAIISGTIKGVGYRLDQPGSVLVLRNLIASDTYAVTDEIAEVLDFGAKTIPAFMLHESDLPTESGFVVFESVCMMPDGRGQPLAVKAISWDTVHMQRDQYVGGIGISNEEIAKLERAYKDVASISGILLVAYTDPTDPRDHMHEEWMRDLEIFYRANSAVPAALPMSAGLWEFGREPLNEYKHDSLIRVLATFLRFVQEPWVDPRAIVPGRQAVKRAIRAKIEPSVHVVQLRKRADSHHRQGDDPQPGNYSHRWFVRAHWRRQWYPSEQRHAPRFVQGYVKGPSDKPFVAKDTIFSVDR